MEEALRACGILEKPSKPPKDAPSIPLRKEDIDLIVHISSICSSLLASVHVRLNAITLYHRPTFSVLSDVVSKSNSSLLCPPCQVQEFEIPRAQAEKVLTESDGDITKALRALVSDF